jgi:hypothetical protein
MQSPLPSTLRRLAVIAGAGLAASIAAATAHAADGAAAPACSSVVETGVLPLWARAGFSEARPRSAHVTGRTGAIMAVLFANPLVSPPAHGHDNKILWVARTTPAHAATLSIRAQRMSGTTSIGAPVSRRVAGGPGPSIVDLPAPGCWRLTLSWYGHSDTLDLRYR